MYNYDYALPVTDTFILQNCTVTSPSIGTIRVSCDSSYQILVTLTCTNNCSNPMVTIIGYSPLTVRGLDPGMVYSVIINVFNGTQVLFMELKITKNITVMNDDLGTYITVHKHLRSYPLCICIPYTTNFGSRKLYPKKFWQK